MNNTLKRHLTSATITFVTLVAVSLAFQLTNGAITADNVSADLVLSVLLTACRAGIKGVAEFFGLSGDQ